MILYVLKISNKSPLPWISHIATDAWIDNVGLSLHDGSSVSVSNNIRYLNYPINTFSAALSNF